VEAAQLLNFAGLEAERDQLWAEAWHLYSQGGVKYWEVEGASKEAEKYVVESQHESAISDLVEKWIKQRPEGLVYNGRLMFTFQDILVGLNLDPMKGNTTLNRELYGVLAGLYGRPKNTTGPKGPNKKYYIVE
jgi:hypothetical protein